MADLPQYRSIHDGEIIDAAISRIRNGDLDNLTERAETAATSAQSASTAAQTASAAAVPAAAQAVASATESKSWAVGGTGSRAGEDTDNAKYYASVAREIAGGDYTTPTEARGIANQQIDARAAKLYDATHPYAAGEWCVHAGEVWRNTSGQSVTGVEPGTNYNVWNVGFSNDNLIMNPFFTVNQRGVTTWSSGYGVDRWRTTGQTTVTDSGLVGANDGVIVCERSTVMDSIPIGQTVTLSWKLGNGQIKTLSGSRKTASGGWVLNSGNTGIYYRPGEYSDIQFDKVAGGISCAKLELGPISTIANDGPPEYGTELAKCQEYCVVLGGHTYANLGFGYSFSSSMIAVYLPLPSMMNPSGSLSVTTQGPFRAQFPGGQNVSLPNLNPSGKFINGSAALNLDVPVPTGFPSGWFKIDTGETKGKVIISKDL